MTDSPSNPFRQLQQGAAAPAAGDDSALYPFAARGEGGAEPELRKVLARRIRDMSLGGAKRLATQRAAELTVKDLNDLAAEFSGVQTNNPTLPQLSLEDLNSIEAVFTEVKINTAKAAREAAASGAGAPDVNVSCCSCTPCCCCAAAETEPFGAA
jgi:hypothetical protein